MIRGVGRFLARALRPGGLAVLAIAALLLSAGSAAAQSFVFDRYAISGNQRVEDGTILAFADLAPGARLSLAELNAAGQDIRGSGLFERVDLVPRGRTLAITVVEYPTIARISIEGNSRISDEALLPLLQSAPRRVFTPAQAEADTATIAEAYASQGRINAQVTPRIIQRPDNIVDLVFEVRESAVTEVERISFVGNRSYSERRLRAVLDTKEAGLLRALIGRDTYAPDRVTRDRQLLTDFYRSRGFIDFVIQSVDVSLTRERDAYLVTYNIREGQRFTFGEVTVSSEMPGVDPAEFAGLTTARAGARYSPVPIDNDATRLERAAANRGIRFLKVDPQLSRNPETLSVDINYVLTPAERVIVERIDIQGNGTTLDRVIRNQFQLVERDPLNPREIEESARRIRALGFFQDVSVNTRRGTAPGQEIIDVNVVEGPTGSLSFGANFNTDTGAGLTATYRQSNFQGRGQRLNLDFSTTQSNRRLGFGFTEPQLLGRDLRGSLDLSYVTTDNENALYDTETLRFSPGISFPISELQRLSLFYALEYTDLTDVSASASTIIQNEAAIGGVWTNALGYTLSYDNRRTGLNPTAGVVLRFGQEFGIGDTQFIQSTALAGVETLVLNEELTLRATLEGGSLYYISGDSRVTDRFFLGSRTMRGFEASGIGPRDALTDDALGGNTYAALRLEAEFPVGLPTEYGITGGVFADYGSVWDVGETYGQDVIYNDVTPRAVIGAALFWDTPIGPLRFNFTRPLLVEDGDNTRNFDVTVSTRF